jgi:Abnormal spindle-like microcephaly-assoc'd, ASPM-SPD-2-Hydin
VSVTFTPATSGPRSASLTVTDNAAGSPHSVALNGTGALPANTYLTDGFESGTLAPGWHPTAAASSSVSVVSAPVNSGNRAAALTNASSGQYAGMYADLSPGPQSSTYTRFCFQLASGLTGTTILAQGRASNGQQNMWEADYDAASKGLDVYVWNGSRTRTDLYLAAGLVLPGRWYCAELQFVETKSGRAQVWLNGVSVGSVTGDFSATNPYARLWLFNTPAGGSVYMDDVKVAAGAIGPTGAGAGPLPGPAVGLSPSSLTFPSTTPGQTSAAQSVTLTNTGTNALTISSVGLSGANPGDFAQTNTCPLGPATLAAGASCTVSVTFTPAATGSRSASLIVTDNASGSPHTVALSGTGASAPAVGLSPSSLTFASTTVGQSSAPQSVTVSNTGSGSLTISSIGVSGASAGDFGQTNNCPGSLAAGASCTVSVTFTPTASGARNASVVIADNAGGSPHSVPLSGTGALPSSTYLSDGFEGGTLAGWQTLAASGSTVSVQNGVVRTGSYAAALANSGPGQYSGMFADLTPGPQSSTFTRFCYQLSGLSGTTILAQARDVNGAIMWELDYDFARQSLDAYFWNGARARTDLYAPTSIVVAGTWQCVEIQFNEAVAGHAELWLDGVSVAAADADLSATNNYSRLILWNDPAGGTVYLDDVVVAGSFVP